MDIQEFMRIAEELTGKGERKIIGQPLKKNLKLKNILKAKHSPYRKEIETKIIPIIYELFPFSERPDSLSSSVLKESLYFYSKFEESDFRDIVQKSYLNNLQQNLEFSKKTMYDNIEKIFNEKMEQIELNSAQKVNELPLIIDQEYEINMKILRNLFKLKKINPDPVKWFNTTLKIDYALNYKVKDFIYSTQSARDLTTIEYYLEYSNMQLKNKE